MSCQHEHTEIVGEYEVCVSCGIYGYADPVEVCKIQGHDNVEVEGILHCTRCSGFKPVGS